MTALSLNGSLIHHFLKEFFKTVKNFAFMMAYFFDVLMLCWKEQRKCCANIGNSVRRNKTSMVLHNFFTDGKSYTRAIIIFFMMQPLEQGENAFCVLLFKSQSIVSN